MMLYEKKKSEADDHTSRLGDSLVSKSSCSVSMKTYVWAPNLYVKSQALLGLPGAPALWIRDRQMLRVF